MTINPQTRKFGIIGYPLGHTFSPFMHNAAFETTGYNGVYLVFPMRNLLRLKHSLRQLSISGLSVTIPYKIRIARIVDKIDPLALQIGSINTVLRNEDDLLEGYNTDGSGAVKAIEEAGIDISKQKILIIGSGGSARAIAFALLGQNPQKLAILARNRRVATGLVKNLRLVKKAPPLEVIFYPESRRRNHRPARIRPEKRIIRSVLENPDQTAEYDLVIQTTPMGMKGHPSQRSLPLTKEYLHPHQCLFDIVYNPLMTDFLKQAKSRKLKIITGEKMLLYQGALQFELFTGQKAPIAVMEQALKTALKQK